MKKKIALGIAVVGATLLTLSLTAFGIGAAATLHAGSIPDVETGTALSVVAPIRAAAPSPHPTSAASPNSVAESAEPAESADPLESAAFTAMTSAEQAEAKEWLETQRITASCMKDKGFDYTFVPWWKIDRSLRPVSWVNTLPESERAAAFAALWGDTGAGADYHWDDAGCWGYAVHIMGNDGGN